MTTSSRQRAFTLIELLTVMVIILILAGIVLGLVKYANEKAARAKAESQIKAIETALESYKSDNGAYPSDSVYTDGLNARTQSDPSTSSPAYNTSSAVLYMAITGDLNGDGTGTVAAGTYGKTYYNIPNSDLYSNGTATIPVTVGGTSKKSRYIIDPFGNSYGYSTAYAAAVATTPTQTPTVGYNPTFDLWSTGGYGPSKSYPADIAANQTWSTLWIKNW